MENGKRVLADNAKRLLQLFILNAFYKQVKQIKSNYAITSWRFYCVSDLLE